MSNEIPRRNKIYEFIPAEKAIYAAKQEVEKLAADVRLTDAINFLSLAQDRVADFVDGVNPESYATGSSVAAPEEK